MYRKRAVEAKKDITKTRKGKKSTLFLTFAFNNKAIVWDKYKVLWQPDAITNIFLLKLK